jgi:ABC-2 type transport system permease protein
MSAWQRIAAVTRKELKQLSRDRLTFGMIVGIPLLQMMLFGFAINFDVRELRAGVADAAHTSRSRQLVAELEATQVLKVVTYADSPAELQRDMRAGDIVIGIVIPADFERRLLDGDRPAAQVLLDGSEPTLESAARGFGALPALRRPGLPAPQAAQLFEIRTEYNPEKRTAVQIVPALIGVILNMTMVIFTAGAIVRERERGNLELLITTPVSSGELMLGKLIPYVLIGLTQTTLILTVGHLLFDVPVNGTLLELYAAAMLFIAATLSLGLLISSFVKTQFQAFQLAFMTMLPSILMSGFMFPFDGMPRAAQYIAQVLPLTHFNDLVRGIVLRGAHLSDYPLPIAKLALFFAITLTLAMLRFQKRLD